MILLATSASVSAIATSHVTIMDTAAAMIRPPAATVSHACKLELDEHPNKAQHHQAAEREYSIEKPLHPEISKIHV
ncbi:MAG: hypothetical protein AAFR17_13905 [Pseudomonadota bacterium]